MPDPGSVIVGMLGAIIGISFASRMNDRGDVQTCVEAYYSDKYNSVRYGSPNATFVTCMQKNFPETFARTEKRFNPQNVTLAQPQ